MWPNPQETEDLVKFTDKILNGKPFSVQCIFYIIPITLIAVNYFRLIISLRDLCDVPVFF